MLNQFPQCAAFHIKSGFLYEMQNWPEMGQTPRICTGIKTFKHLV